MARITKRQLIMKAWIEKWGWEFMMEKVVMKSNVFLGITGMSTSIVIIMGFQVALTWTTVMDATMGIATVIQITWNTHVTTSIAAWNLWEATVGVEKSASLALKGAHLATKNYLTTKKTYLVKKSKRKIEKSAKDLKNATSVLKLWWIQTQVRNNLTELQRREWN